MVETDKVGFRAHVYFIGSDCRLAVTREKLPYIKRLGADYHPHTEPLLL